jgi:hypothetical protein
MSKPILIAAFLTSLLIAGCDAGSISGPFDYDRDTPPWLKAKIDSIAAIPDHFGTTVYRYEWNGEFVYHIENLVSSCAYCELYDHNGIKLEFTNDETFQDFLENKKNEVVVWPSEHCGTTWHGLGMPCTVT